jgi:integrase
VNPKRKNDEGKNEMGLLNDTVAKYVENLKNFMKWSLERSYHKNREFQRSDFSSRRKQRVQIVTLTFDELKKFFDYDFSNDIRLERVRDLFCFACFTGQRWDDVINFDKEDIKGDSWEFTARKPPKKKVIVPFLGYVSPALDILKKYNLELFDEYIKEAAEVAELNRLVSLKRERGREEVIDTKPLHRFITMHTGRRTCVSLLLNVEKMPIPQVMDLTQHSDFKTLRKYINEDPDALRKNLGMTKSVIDFKLEVVKNVG